MSKTRSKSSAKAMDVDPPAAEPTLTILMPQDLDLQALMELLPAANLVAPSSNTVIELYKLLLAQNSELDTVQRELDESRAEAERKDVELDQALQDRERVSSDLEAQLETIQGDFQRVQAERDQLVVSQKNLQAEIATISQSNTSSSSEAVDLKRRLEDTEREKRELVGVISRLKEEGGQREEEIQTLRGNLKEARHDYQALESQVRELRSTEASTKFKFDSISQQFQLSQTETSRLNEELNSKSEEFTKYRRTKQAELVTLQANMDSLTQSHNSSQATLKSLQAAHTHQTQQLTQALTRVQDLSGQLAEQEATYASEANVLRRLVEAMEGREKQAKEIVDNIEQEWAGVCEKADAREAVLREEVQRERAGREDAERKLDRLELVLTRMGQGELPTPGRGGTPLRISDETADGMMGLSPTVAMASRAQKTGRTFTEVYADYVRLQEDFATKCTEYDRMEGTLASVLAQIEERAPVLSQQRAEYDRLQSEAAQLASQLAQALVDRDAQASIAQESSQKLSKTTRENALLEQQLGDLGRQVQNLLRELGRQQDPSLPPEDELQLVPAAEDVEEVITNHLVLFNSIDALQHKNQSLLKIVREMGQKMENDEREYRESMETEQGEAVREAHEAIQELSAELEGQKRSSESIIQAYVKERDALRAMLARAGKDPAGQINGTGTSEPLASQEMARELAAMQNQFDAYRHEITLDSGKLRDDAAAAQREVGQLGAALAKAQAKIEFLQERLRMTQDQFAMHGQEVDDLNKRNQQLFDQWTRVDIECGRLSEDLRVSSGQVEQLRNECANLRAEKKIWESAQTRLTDENKTLAMERSHLSDLMGNVQKMHIDLERSGENERRRLESQLQLLESQIQDLRGQVSHERDSSRNISLQKDIDLKELQMRLDRTAQELSRTRESLIGAETSQKHMEERIADLTKQLQGNEEKLAVYERRPGSGHVHSSIANQDMSHEQQLEAEVAELRSALKVAQVDLAAARAHVQQFKEISQASEAALESLNTTYDEYKASTEAQITRLESECNAVKEKLDSALQEQGQLSAKSEELRKALETERNAWTADKKVLEDTIVDLSTSEKYSESDRTSRETAVREQQERAQAAEVRYSNEIVAHAATIKVIDGLKKQLADAQVTARDKTTAAETASAKLTSSEASWKQQKDALDKQIENLNLRCQDLGHQNSLLHQHLESVSSQATRIRQAVDSTATVNGAGETDDADGKLQELRTVVAYLRKEKEIVDLQLELSKQENIRLKGQVDHLSQTLNETRASLTEERERAVETAASAAQHAELLERVNQLNILRESNATLRADCEKYTKRSKELEAKIRELTSQVDPLKEQARVAQAELEARDGQLKRLEEESRRWQERNSQLLSKYDRIDPAEVQALKDEIEKLKTEKGEAEASLTQRISALQENVARFKPAYSQAQNTIKTLKDQLANEQSTHQTQTQESGNTIAALKAQNNALLAAKSDAEKSAVGTSPEADSIILVLTQERDQLLAEKAARTATESAGADGNAQWETEKAQLMKDREAALTQAKLASDQAQRATGEVRNQKLAFERLQTRLQETMKAREADSAKAALEQQQAVSAAVESVRTELQTGTSSTPSVDPAKHAEALRNLEATLSAKHQAELEAARKQNPSSGSGDVAAALATQEKQFVTKLAAEVEAATERGRAEIATRMKLKDSQLVRSQLALKELEKKIQGWRDEGILPAEGDSPGTAAKPAKTVTAPVASGSTASAPAPAAAPKPSAPVRGRGAAPRAPPRGGAGGLAIRGRGGAPANNPPLSGGVTIHGAAKRPREDGAGPATEDTLAKRLKPTPPVQIKRPAPPGP
ncbi:hypothetical protein C8J56DRAFT_1019894 [Mycena floridula]|nr:hypothetical protein C8J56DRAFT_1019894 [Mycena floridula]